MKKQKKSLRMKMVQLIVKEYIEDNLFEQIDDNLKIGLQNKLNETFAFKCELFKFEIKNYTVIGQICVVKEFGEIGMVDFNVLPTAGGFVNNFKL